MAVACEFIDVIVPIERIDAVYPGGFAAFKSQNADLSMVGFGMTVTFFVMA